jgi:hypothetical protein
MWESSTALCQPGIVVSGEKNRHKGRECGIDCHQIVIVRYGKISIHCRGFGPQDLGDKVNDTSLLTSVLTIVHVCYD